MTTTIPISEVVPLSRWIRLYHNFRAKLCRRLNQTKMTPLELHRDKLGPPVRPGVWETDTYCVFLQGLSISFEVSENLTTEESLKAFREYQDHLFRR